MRASVVVVSCLCAFFCAVAGFDPLPAAAAGPRPGVKPEPVATRFAGPRGGRGSDPFRRSTPFYVMQYAPVDDTV